MTDPMSSPSRNRTRVLFCGLRKRIHDLCCDLRNTAAVPSKHGSDSRTCEGVFHNADVNTNVVGLITDCTGDFGTTAGVPDSAAMGGVYAT